MSRRWLWIGLLWALPLAAQPASAPSADDIVARLLERCRTTPERLAAQHHLCVRHTVQEELDGDGSVKERKTKEQMVELRGEAQRIRLLKLDGRAPTAKETGREAEKEAEIKRLAERKDKARSRGPDFVDEKLIRRFHYQSLGTATINGRTAYVLRFTPLAGQPAKDAADRVLNQLTGSLWVDAEEFELVKLEARLKEPLTVLGGVVASLNRLEFTVERRRQADGFWFNTAFGSYAEGRKLLSGFRVRSHIEQDGFRPLPR